MGNPDHILPKNGDYVLEIYAAGEVLETPMKWDVTTMKVTFTSEELGPVASDATYDLKHEIQNYFAPPDK